MAKLTDKQKIGQVEKSLDPPDMEDLLRQMWDQYVIFPESIKVMNGGLVECLVTKKKSKK